MYITTFKDKGVLSMNLKTILLCFTLIASVIVLTFANDNEPAGEPVNFIMTTLESLKLDKEVQELVKYLYSCVQKADDCYESVLAYD